MSNSLLEAQFADLEDIMDTDDFSQPITIQPHDGPPFTLPGLFEDPASLVQSGGNAPAASQQPFVHLAASQLEKGLHRPLTRQDKIVVAGQAYQLQEPQPDGAGLLSIRLKKLSGLAPVAAAEG